MASQPPVVKRGSALKNPSPAANTARKLDEFCDNVRDQRLELLITSVFLGIQHTVAVDDPAHIAGLVGPEDVRSLVLGLGAEQPLNGVHRLNQAVLIFRGQLVQPHSLNLDH